MITLVLLLLLDPKRPLLVRNKQYTCFDRIDIYPLYIAGADIKEMKDNTFIDTYKNNFLGHWAEMIEIKKPIIAAVNGYAVSLCPFFFAFSVLIISFI